MRQDVLDAVKQLSATDTKTLSQKALKLFEEGGELSKAILPYEAAAGTLHRVVHKGHILEEAADCLLVVLSIAYSLGFDDDALASAMQKKSLYWAELQQNEAAVDPNKIPHEIHVTVENAFDADSWRKDCRAIGVKPVMLALHDKMNAVIRDVMTSQVVIGSTKDAFNAMQDTERKLQYLGYKVVRSKIEAAPWHPAAPTATNNLEHQKHNYFESHVEVTVVNNDPVLSMEKLKECLADTDAHVSNNFFKEHDTVKTVMVTLRRYEGTLERFKYELQLLKEQISTWGFSFNPKDIVEYSIYDSNTMHDAGWMHG